MRLCDNDKAFVADMRATHQSALANRRLVWCPDQLRNISVFRADIAAHTQREGEHTSTTKNSTAERTMASARNTE